MDARKFFNDDGTAVPVSKLDDDTAAALAGIEVFEEFEGTGKGRNFVGVTKKFKIASKLQGLEILARHLKLFESEGAAVNAVQIFTNVTLPSRK